ncbi:MAG: hypothetical protein AB7J13_12930 [Pyrinomonadaceae bacterium]
MIRALVLFVLIGSISMITLADGTERLEITNGQQKTADRGRLSIKFVEIVEDSRCPPDVDCIWAGNAKVRIAVAKDKMAPQFAELNTLGGPTSVKLYGYTISLDGLTQNPPETSGTTPCPLVATFSVTK